MLRILFIIIAASVVSFAGTAQATHCNKEYEQVMKGLNVALKSYEGAVARNDAKTACKSGQEMLAWMQAANEIIKRPGCMHKKPARPVDLSPTRKSVANACAQAKAAAKPETAAPKKEKAAAKPPVPPSRPAEKKPRPAKEGAAAQPHNATEARPDAQAEAKEKYALAGVYVQAARSARSVGEYDAAIESYMQAAQAYGEAGDAVLQAEMLASATELAAAKAKKASQPKK